MWPEVKNFARALKNLGDNKRVLDELEKNSPSLKKLDLSNPLKQETLYVLYSIGSKLDPKNNKDDIIIRERIKKCLRIYYNLAGLISIVRTL